MDFSKAGSAKKRPLASTLRQRRAHLHAIPAQISGAKRQFGDRAHQDDLETKFPHTIQFYDQLPGNYA